MTKQLVIIIGVAILAIFLISTSVIIWMRIAKKRRLPVQFREKWLDIQRLCTNKETWGQAVLNADELLDSALKKKRIKGKTMGERLVTAQRRLSDNDSVWYAHNLAKKLKADSGRTMREAQAKKSLVGVRQALRDLDMLNGK